jgi:hypothetical protein
MVRSPRIRRPVLHGLHGVCVHSTQIPPAVVIVGGSPIRPPSHLAQIAVTLLRIPGRILELP